MMRKQGPGAGRAVAAAAVLLLAGGGAALAAGYFTNGLPQAGGSQYPSTSPLTGNELIPADTQLPNGQSPQSESISTQQLANFAAAQGVGGFRNALVNGGMQVWQRGTGTSADISSTTTYWADRWGALGGASSAINISRQTGASDIAAGFGASQRFQRKASNANTAAICVGQAVESSASLPFQGQKAEFSFYAKSGADFSAANSIITATIAYGTGSDESTAALIGGTWTGYTAAIGGAIPITTTMTRYVVQASIPASATQVGVKICFTPVGTAGTNDWFEFTGAQLNVNTGATAGYYGAASGAMPLAFAFETPEAALARAQRYYWNITEPAATVMVGGSGQGATTTTCQVAIPLPVPMRIAPTLAFSGTALGTGTWTITHVATATALATPFLAVLGANTVNQLNMTATVASGLTVGQTCVLTGAAGGSILGATADL